MKIAGSWEKGENLSYPRDGLHVFVPRLWVTLPQRPSPCKEGVPRSSLVTIFIQRGKWAGQGLQLGEEEEEEESNPSQTVMRGRETPPSCLR